MSDNYLSKFIPYIVTYPDVFWIIPVNKLIAVVLPAPLCPSKQNIYDSYNATDILFTAINDAAVHTNCAPELKSVMQQARVKIAALPIN